MNSVSRKVTIGPTTIMGLLVTLLGLVPIASKVVQEGSAVAVNGPERWLAITGIGLGGITLMGRYLQAASGVSQKVKAGVTTVVGWSIGLAGIIPIAIKSYSEGAQALHSPDKYAAIAGVVSLASVSIGRYLQSLSV